MANMVPLARWPVYVIDTIMTSGQWFYLHENGKFIVVILILKHVLFRLCRKTQPSNELSLILHEQVFFVYT